MSLENIYYLNIYQIKDLLLSEYIVVVQDVSLILLPF